jgi:hypothetical protein
MIIKYKNYVLEPTTGSFDCFDLYQTGIGTKGKVKGKPTKYVMGYGYSTKCYQKDDL